MTSSLHDLRWLIEHGNRELERVELPQDPLKLAMLMRKRHSRERARLLCDLRELRLRAVAKFRRANTMFFTRLGLEQATDEVLSRYKALRFVGHSAVCDLCCGIGGDAIGLADQTPSPITIVDLSAENIEIARSNLCAYGIQDCEAVVQDIREIEMSRFTAWHVDPDRRPQQRKRSAPELCHPSLDEVLGLPGLPPDGAIKLSPAAEVDQLLEWGCELEWIGHHRECQQLVAWFGALAEFPRTRTATWVWGHDQHVQSQKLVDDSGEREGGFGRPMGELPRFVYEPRSSVLAAGLVDVLARKFSLRRLSPPVPYLGSNELIDCELVQRFEVVDVFPYRPKTLTSKLGEYGGYLAEVKKRGVDILPEEVMRLRGEPSGIRFVLLLFPQQQKLQAILATRL